MNMNEYIVKEIKELSLESSINSAEKICNEIPVTHIPVADKNILIGCFLESDIRTIENKDDTIGNHKEALTFFYATETDTVLDLITIFSDNDTNILPVINEHKEYLGYYELNDVLDVFNSSPFLYQHGIIITVEKLKKDLSISEIAQIVESNNARLLGIYISKEKSDLLQVTLKVSSEEINTVIQTFRRYNYAIISEHNDDSYLKDLKNRSDYLQKYLDM
ncbi:CBS domain-containing protein [Flavobacteriaceae bacterium S356]|uniref:CBS domain-containing protein n=1 Tax=Asprobacillus argus TaxID=3076534 RepID=A0ABU3LBB7_9FLAO|nr:CBS domain-containing protein [Flavobacteriaceae bacterium S356]